MNAPQTSQPLITVSISQLLGKEIAGLTAQVTDPKWFADGYKPKWRRLKTVKHKMDYKKWWITLHYHTEGADTCGFRGGVEGPTADNMQIQFTAEEFAKIQPPIK
jgi:hypothetical protein